jgi:prevent-host-death family protein
MNDPIISLSDFKSDASQWLKRLQEESDAVVLTQNGRASAVVQSYETFQRQQQALLMLKLLAQGEADIAAGRTIPQEEVFERMEKRLKQGHE